MKKLIYSLAFIALGLVGCTSFDDAVTEKYADGPSVAINIISTTDSAFTFTITPAEGTLYYNFTIDKNDEAETLDAEALLKGQYGNTDNVCKAAEQSSLTLEIDAEPNTTYQIYAVAGSDKGIVGQVAVASVTTTDQHAPALVADPFEPLADQKAVAVDFNQDIELGDGAITGIYYKEWDWDNPVTIDPEDIIVDLDGNTAILSAPTTPDGAIVCFSWEAGAFVDAKGNKCGAFTTVYNEEKDDFIGAAVQNKKVAFEIADSCFAEPQTSFKDPAEFKGVVRFDFNIYRIDDFVKDGDVCVSFTGKTKTTTIKLSADEWDVDGNTLTFTLPQGIESGDYVTVSFEEGIFFDVYGNPNAAYDSADKEIWWKYITFTPTAADVLGTFTYYATLNSNGKTYKLGNFTISEYTGEDAEPGDVTISNLYLDGSEIYGFYDLTTSKLYIKCFQPLGTYEEKGETYGVLTYSMSNQKSIEFDITEEGIISTDFALVYTDAAYSSLIGYEVPAAVTTFVKAEETSAARKTAAFGQSFGFKKYANVKSVKGTPTKVKQLRK